MEMQIINAVALAVIAIVLFAVSRRITWAGAARPSKGRPSKAAEPELVQDQPSAMQKNPKNKLKFIWKTVIGTLLTAFYGGAILRKIERVQKDKH